VGGPHHCSTRFPYTTLFRSMSARVEHAHAHLVVEVRAGVAGHNERIGRDETGAGLLVAGEAKRETDRARMIGRETQHEDLVGIADKDLASVGDSREAEAGGDDGLIEIERPKIAGGLSRG